MKIRTILVACILVISSLTVMSLAVFPITAEASKPITEPGNETEKPEAHGTISIEGSAFLDCAPDRLVIILEIIGKDLESAQVARKEASTILDQTLSALRHLGFSDDDIETTSYNLEAKYEWEDGKNVFKGYFATVTVKVTLKEDEFEKAGSVIDNSVDAGAFVKSINFELSREKREELKLQLLADAAKDAKLKAETIVAALGDELGDVSSIRENNYNYEPYVYFKGRVNSDDGAGCSAPPTTILPSDLTISAKVDIVFEVL